MKNGWLEYSFPFGAFRPIFRGDLFVSGSVGQVTLLILQHFLFSPFCFFSEKWGGGKVEMVQGPSEPLQICAGT